MVSAVTPVWSDTKKTVRRSIILPVRLYCRHLLAKVRPPCVRTSPWGAPVRLRLAAVSERTARQAPRGAYARAPACTIHPATIGAGRISGPESADPLRRARERQAADLERLPGVHPGALRRRCRCAVFHELRKDQEGLPCPLTRFLSRNWALTPWRRSAAITPRAPQASATSARSARRCPAAAPPRPRPI